MIKIEYFVKTLAKLLGRSNLDALPSSQNCVINKGEIDFTHRKEQKYKKKNFEFQKTIYIIVCDPFLLFEKGSCIKHMCVRNLGIHSRKYVCILKGNQNNINLKGLNINWVPKNYFNMLCRYAFQSRCLFGILIVAAQDIW